MSLDWRLSQLQSRIAAVDVAKEFSSELMQRLGNAGAKLYLIGETLIVKCQNQDDVYLLAAFVCDDLRSEIKEKEMCQIRYIEIWHELTNEKYRTPVFP